MIKVRVLAFAALLTMTMTAISYGQGGIRVNVPMAFNISGKVLPAGNYVFSPTNGSKSITVAGVKDSATALVLTRLATEIHTTPKDSHIVFDKIGEDYFLSEIWIAGSDGFVLRTTEESHTHKVLNAPNP
jgi:hypothetical protein